VIDLVLCGALLALGVLATSDAEVGSSGVLDTLVMPFVVLPLLLRGRAPLLAAAAFAAGAVISGVPTFDQLRCGLAMPVALLILYSLGARAPLREAVGGLLLVLAGLLFIGYTDVVLEGDGVGFATFAFPLCAGTWWAGRVVGSRDAVAAELQTRSLALERQREQTARMAVEVERTRLATDLDVAARARLHTMIALAEPARPPARTRRARRSHGSRGRAGRRSTRCARCWACCAATSAERARPGRPWPSSRGSSPRPAAAGATWPSRSTESGARCR